MTNRSELLINAVTDAKPKMLTGLNQKVRGWGRSSRTFLPQTVEPPADRRGLTHRGTQTERGKPVVSPEGKAPRKVCRRGCGYRRMEEAKAAL